MSSENSFSEDEKEQAAPKEVAPDSEERQQSQENEKKEDNLDDNTNVNEDKEQKTEEKSEKESESSQGKPSKESDNEEVEEKKESGRDRDRRRRREDDRDKERDRRRRREDETRGRDRKERERRDRRDDDKRERHSDRRRREPSSEKHQSHHRDRRTSTRPYSLKVSTRQPSINEEDIRQLLSTYSSSIISIKPEKSSDGSCHIVEIEGREARDRVLKSYGNGEGRIGDEKVSIRETRSRSERDRDRDEKGRDKEREHHKREREHGDRSKDRKDKRERDSRRDSKREPRDKEHRDRDKERDRDHDRERRSKRESHHRDRREKSREKAKDKRHRPSRDELKREPMMSDEYPNSQVAGYDTTENKKYMFKAADLAVTAAALAFVKDRDEGKMGDLRKPVCHHYKNEQTCRYGTECIYLHVKHDADRLEVGKACPGEDVNLAKQPHFETTLLVRDIDKETDARGRRMTDDDFREMFCEIGGFVSSQCIRDSNGLYGGPYGIVVFKNAACANEAICQTFGYSLNIGFYGVEEMLQAAADPQQPGLQ